MDKSFNVFIMNALNLCVSGLYANGPEYVPAAGKRRDLPLRFYAKNPGRNTRNGLGSKAKRPEKAI